MQPQLAIAWDAAHVGADDWSAVLAWCRRVVDVVGHKEVAYRLDVQPSQLTDALLERERKDVKAKWISVLLHLAPESLVREYLEIVCRQNGYEAPKKIRVRTAEEENREMRARLAELAPGVLALLDKEMGR